MRKSPGHYFNTTKIPPGMQLDVFEQNAKTQEQRIYLLCRYLNKISFPISPSAILQLYELQFSNILLTSVRRSISNLAKRGKLKKTNEKVIGLHGHPELVWKLI